jgi:hypothetical protein
MGTKCSKSSHNLCGGGPAPGATWIYNIVFSQPQLSCVYVLEQFNSKKEATIGLKEIRKDPEIYIKKHFPHLKLETKIDSRDLYMTEGWSSILK